MKFFSFVKEGFFFTPVEIQVNLLPGLPEVKFTGLVDTAIKESAIRLKSAFKKSGFQWPVKQQIIINISPAYIRKTSPGMDLALASSLLWKTGQMDFSHYRSSSLYLYGEVDLNAKVLSPEGWKTLPTADKPLVIGSVKEKNYKQGVYSVHHLKELYAGNKLPVADWKERLKRPKMPDIFFSKKASELLKIAAIGEHSLLLCGSAGSGKTTLAEHLYYLLLPPCRRDLEELEHILNVSQKWRTFINPHHTTTLLSMVGGGSPLFLGEISKAHGGVLFLDEYLEFHPKVQEALREPLEKGEIRLVRKGQCMVLPSRFLLVATSNLCPCGDYEPSKPVECSYSLNRCRAYLNRLSGPMMDRFDLLAFSRDWKGKREVSLKSIQRDVKNAWLFRLNQRHQEMPNAYLDLKDLENMIGEDVTPLLPQSCSHRRRRALLRVSRTLSDIKQEMEISPSSLAEAIKLTVKNFFFLKNRILTD